MVSAALATEDGRRRSHADKGSFTSQPSKHNLSGEYIGDAGHHRPLHTWAGSDAQITAMVEALPVRYVLRVGDQSHARTRGWRAELSGVWKSPGPGSSNMGNTQYAIFFKQRPHALPSMIYFTFRTKIITYVQLATLCSHKMSQNMGFFNKKPFGGPLTGGPMILHSVLGGPMAWGGHWQGGGMVAIVVD